MYLFYKIVPFSKDYEFFSILKFSPNLTCAMRIEEHLHFFEISHMTMGVG